MLLNALLVFDLFCQAFAGYLAVRHLENRQLDCEVNCGDDYCCDYLTKCQALGDIWECIDPFVTDANGNPETYNASNPTLLNSLLSVVEVTVSTDIPSVTSSAHKTSTGSATAAKTSTTVPPTNNQPSFISNMHGLWVLLGILVVAIPALAMY